MSTYIKRGGLVAAVLYGCLVLTLSAHAASFDCAKAQTKVEHLICDNPEISKLDEELAASYKALLQDQTKATQIRQAQKQWVKERNSCMDANCVMITYQKRLLVLSQAQLNGPQSQIIKNAYRPAKSKLKYELLHEGPYEPLSEICEEFAAMLNAFGPEEPQMWCEQKLHPAFSKFKPIELLPLSSKDNFKYFSAIHDLAVRETILRGYTPYPLQPGDLEREFEQMERLGGYKYYFVTTDRFIKNKTVTLLIQERQGDCRVKNAAMDSARRIAYAWDMATESVVQSLFSFQTIFTYEGESMQGDGVLTSYWNEAELPIPSGKSGGIWVNQADGNGAQSPICHIVYNSKR